MLSTTGCEGRMRPSPRRVWRKRPVITTLPSIGAYYACFYTASAVLLQEGCKFVKHSGVRSAVHQDLVKTGRLDVRWGDVYDQLFDSRYRADYIALAEFDAENAAELIREAEGFVLEMRRLLKG